MADGKFHVYFFDVPVGDSFLIQSPHGKNIVIDGGIDSSVASRLGEVFPFWQRTIDLLVISHPDLDHLTGALALVRSHDVRGVLLSGAFAPHAFFQDFLKIVEEKKIPIFLAHENKDFVFDGLFFDILFPNSSLVGKKTLSMNNSSVVFRVSYGEDSVLFTGDIEKETEKILLSQASSLQSSLLKVAHHGSRTSSLSEFLSAVSADHAVISAGRENSFGHPHEEVLIRLGGIPTFVTKELGTIHAISDGFGFQFITAVKRSLFL